MDKDRAKKLDTVFDQIEKQFGEGSLMKLGSADIKKIPAISTGALSIDLALGIGGIPKGRVVEIYGPESSGKTTLSLHVAAEAQKAGGVAAFIDAEHALDPIYAAALGVDIDELLVSQPDTGEQALEIADMLIESGGVDIVVIDSVAALVPKAEIDGEMGQSHVGLQARLMSQALRKLTGSINKTQTTVIYFSNSYDLEIRLQSEDRAHRIGQKDNVTYVDLVSPGTIDERILTALRDKINIAGNVLGESTKNWLI